jgi:DNA (cytosine-5)-methyltransferase 1
LKVLDLFCGAGGASMGLHLAWPHAWIVGVDIEPQPRYPFTFIQGDATKPPVELAEFDFIWASPLCQRFCAYQRSGRITKEYPDFIPQTRALLEASGKPYVIENVPGAPLLSPFMLCGSMFGLDVRRHRLFESSVPLLVPPCQHPYQPHQRKYKSSSTRKNPRFTIEVGAWDEPVELQREAMGIDWMEVPELSQAIPPAYSEFIARRVFADCSSPQRSEP